MNCLPLIFALVWRNISNSVSITTWVLGTKHAGRPQAFQHRIWRVVSKKRGGDEQKSEEKRRAREDEESIAPEEKRRRKEGEMNKKWREERRAREDEKGREKGENTRGHTCIRSTTLRTTVDELKKHKWMRNVKKWEMWRADKDADLFGSRVGHFS